MRKTITANEGSSVYLFAIFVGSVLTLLASIILRKTGAGVFCGMAIADWVGYALMQVGFVSTVFVFARVRRLDTLSFTHIRGTLNIKQIALLPFISIAAILAFLPLANLWTSFFNLIGYDNLSVAMPSFPNIGIYFLCLFVMAVLPAFGEELLMRGSVFAGLSTRGGWFGVLMSALFFSLMHANPLQTVHQFGLGVVLAIAVALSGSLWAGVAIHFFNNFISITISAYISEIDYIYYRLGYWNWLTGAASVITGLILLVILLYLFYRAKKDAPSYRVVSGNIEYDGYTLYASSDDGKKSNVLKDAFAFFASLFSKRGWQNAGRAIERRNGAELLGRQQNMSGVWVALAIVCVYWVINLIAGAFAV